MKDINKRDKKTPKLCLVSSSGGHWEQLQKLKILVDKYDGFLVTERTNFEADAQYLMKQTDLKDKMMLFKMLYNSILAIKIWIKERPDFVITTGTMVAYPFYLLSIKFIIAIGSLFSHGIKSAVPSSIDLKAFSKSSIS